MPISINGTGSITGLSAGGLPDNSIVTADIADSAVTTAKVNDAAITSAKLAQPLTLATAQNSTSGTAIDFTGIPSWAKKIRVMFNRVSLSGSDHFLIQLGSGSITTSGYVSRTAYLVNDTSANTVSSTSGIILWGGYAAQVTSGIIEICLMNDTSFIYVSSHSLGDSDSGGSVKTGGGAITLSGIMDRLRVTTNGTNTFDAGSINIMYEG